MKRFYKNSSDFKTFVMALFCALPFFFVVSFGCSKSGKDDRNAKDKTAADAKFLEDLNLELTIAPEPIELPASIGVSFDRFIFARTGALTANSVVSISPQTPGTFKASKRNEIEFVPDKPFEFGKKYSISILQVETKEGIIKSKSGSPAVLSFKTPEFKALDAELRYFDEKNGSLEIRLWFSGPFNFSEAAKKIRVLSAGSVLAAKTSKSPGGSAVEITAFNGAWKNKKTAEVSIELAKGTPSFDYPDVKAAGFKKTIKASVETKKAEIYSAYLYEGQSGFHVRFICRDFGEDEEKARYYWDRKTRQEYRISRKCLPSDSSVKAYIKIHPEVSNVSAAYEYGGFRLTGDFKQGEYKLTIGAGAKFAEGGTLFKSFDYALVVPARKPALSFNLNGRYLIRSALKKLPLRHMNVESAKIFVRHVPKENLAFWLGASKYDETTTEFNSDLILNKEVALKGRVDKSAVTQLDLSEDINPDLKGLIEITAVAGNARDSKRLLLTDINLAAKFDAKSGETYVWALSSETNQPMADVEIKHVVYSGRGVGSCVTDYEGFCKLPKFDDKQVDKSRPFAIFASTADDATYLQYSDLREELGSLDVSGPNYGETSAYIAAVYSDRGVYRPGETAHISAILRGKDSLAPKEGMPVVLQIADPRGNVAKKTIIKTGETGLISMDYKLEAFAPTGRYTVNFSAGGVSAGTYAFNVEEFVPERMKVAASFDKEEYYASETAKADFSAVYLFGGSAAGSPYEVNCFLSPFAFSPKKNKSYSYSIFNPTDLPPQGLKIGAVAGELDREGKGKAECKIDDLDEKTPQSSLIEALVSVFESGGGRSTVKKTSAKMHPEKFYLGLKTNLKSAERNDKIITEGIIADWEGEKLPISIDVQIDLKKVETEYGYYYYEDEWDGGYNSGRSKRITLMKSMTVKAESGAFKFELSPDGDAETYIIEARAGKAKTSVGVKGRGYYYWDGYYEGGGGGNRITSKPMAAADILIETDPVAYVGKTLKASFDAPYPGRVLMTAETNEIIAAKWITVKTAGKVEWTVIPTEFAPNVYISALFLKDPRAESSKAHLPERAIGVASVKVDPSQYKLAFEVKAPKEINSNSRLDVTLDFGGALNGKTEATVALVDEGILSLTSFKTPDPLSQIFQKRALGVITYDTVGWNVGLPQSVGGPMGGGEGGGEGMRPGVKPVALFKGPLEVPKNGKLVVSFNVPQYRGKLRVMAVAVDSKKSGSGSAETVVSDPIVVQSTFPRFLLAGDEAVVPAAVTNMTGKNDNFNVSISFEPIKTFGAVSYEGAEKSAMIELVGTTRKTLSLAGGAAGRALFKVKALMESGAVAFKITAKGGGFTSEETVEVPLESTNPKSSVSFGMTLSEGKTDLTKYLPRFVKGTGRSSFWVTNNPYGEAFKHLSYLLQYPYGCIEQTTSSTRPLLYAQNVIGGVDSALLQKGAGVLEEMVAAGIARVLSMQTPSGGFSYWPGGQNPTYYATAYGTQLLIEAQKAGYSVAKERLDDAVNFIERQLANSPEERGDDYYYDYLDASTEAYMHYILALYGKGQKEKIKNLLLNSEYKKRDFEGERKYLLAAALYLSGDKTVEADLKRLDSSPISDKRLNYWSYFTDMRARSVMLSVFVDLFGADPAGKPLADALAEALTDKKRGSYYWNTNELGWAMVGLGKWTKAAGVKEFKDVKLIADGREIKQTDAMLKSGAASLGFTLERANEYAKLEIVAPKLESKAKPLLIINSEGILAGESYPVGGRGLKVERKYKPPDDKALNAINLGDLIYCELEITNLTNSPIHNVVLLDRFPSAFEIENPRLNRGYAADQQGETLWRLDYMNARDDRIELFGSLKPKETRTYVYVMRAVSSGKFMFPPIEAQAMYDSTIWARERKETAAIIVKGPWDKGVD